MKLSEELQMNARQIAAHIFNEDFSHAKQLFERCISELKHFEACALRDQVHAEVKVIEQRHAKSGTQPPSTGASASEVEQ